MKYTNKIEKLNSLFGIKQSKLFKVNWDQVVDMRGCVEMYTLSLRFLSNYFAYINSNRNKLGLSWAKLSSSWNWT